MHKKIYIFFIVLIGSILIVTLSNYIQKNKTKEINLETSKELSIETILPAVLKKSEPVRIAIGSMITPSEGYAYYKLLLDYIEEKIGRDVKLVDRGSYAEVNALLESGNIDIAFVCGGPYVAGHDKFGLELLVAPQTGGKSIYYSYIIVPVNSLVKSFEELRGKTFAFADPGSNTGKLFPTYMLSLMKETPDSFFERYIYTYAHEKTG
jgi:phosphonate transport system substrate-binding protein